MQNQNAYGKVSSTSMPVDQVEEWLNEFEHKRAENKPNGGIIKSTTSIIFIENARCSTTPADKKQAIARGRREFNQAMKNIAKQEAIDARALRKLQAKWRKEKSAAERARQRKSSGERLNSNKKKVKSVIRRKKMVKILSEGGCINCAALKDGMTEYNRQRGDIGLAIAKDGLNIVRVRNIKTKQSYYIVDCFARASEALQFTGGLRVDDTSCMIAQLSDGKLMTLDNFSSKMKSVSQTMVELSNKHNVDVSTVLTVGGGIIGWVVI
jgi:hypothetical protein